AALTSRPAYPLTWRSIRPGSSTASVFGTAFPSVDDQGRSGVAAPGSIEAAATSTCNEAFGCVRKIVAGHRGDTGSVRAMASAGALRSPSTVATIAAELTSAGTVSVRA